LSELHSGLHVGPHTRDGDPAARPAHGETSTFDREINLKAIAWSVIGLVAVTVASVAVVWWMLRAIERADERRDVKLTPIEAANPQIPPPEPRLQIAPQFGVLPERTGAQASSRSDREDLDAERRQEEEALARPAWIDRGRGTVRVPIEVAMDVIAARGVAPEVVGGKSGAAKPGAAPPGDLTPVPSPIAPPPAGRGAPPPKEGGL